MRYHQDTPAGWHGCTYSFAEMSDKEHDEGKKRGSFPGITSWFINVW
jgi:hypothetical protein